MNIGFTLHVMFFLLKVVTACRVSGFQVQQNFEQNRFEGRWYFKEIFAPNSNLDEESFSNRQHTYQNDGQGGLDVFVRGRSGNGTCNYLRREVERSPGQQNPAKMVFKNGNSVMQYWVIGTDYTSYAVIYGCARFVLNDNCLTGYSWILVRDINVALTTEQENAVSHMITGLCLSRNAFTSISHEMEECRQCSRDTWTVQGNFDLNGYLGPWYEMAFIPRTPFPREFASSNYLHTYELLPNGNISVLIEGRDPAINNQCFANSQLLSIKTTSVPGKLTVFETPGDDYWVIGTDFTGYALVLGCVRNPDTPQGQCIGTRSWIWSRTPYLSSTQFIQVSKLLDQFCINEDDYYITAHDNPCPRNTGGSGKIEVCVTYDKSMVKITEL